VPKVSDQHREARRRQILEAAYRCFGEKGFHAATMRDVCREAGLSPGAVYNYYESKDEIVAALAACGRTSTRSVLEGIPRPGQAPGALAAIARHLLALLDEPATVESSRFDVRLWGEAVHTPRLQELCREAITSAADPFAAVIRDGQARGEIDPGLDADTAGRVLLAIFLGLQVQKAIDPGTAATGAADSVAALLGGTFAIPGSRDEEVGDEPEA
jgi:AcrR family transcriptional regulator